MKKASWPPPPSTFGPPRLPWRGPLLPPDGLTQSKIPLCFFWPKRTHRENASGESNLPKNIVFTFLQASCTVVYKKNPTFLVHHPPPPPFPPKEKVRVRTFQDGIYEDCKETEKGGPQLRWESKHFTCQVPFLPYRAILPLPDQRETSGGRERSRY